MYPLDLLKVMHDVIALVEEGANHPGVLYHSLYRPLGEDLILQIIMYKSIKADFKIPHTGDKASLD